MKKLLMGISAAAFAAGLSSGANACIDTDDCTGDPPTQIGDGQVAMFPKPEPNPEIAVMNQIEYEEMDRVDARTPRKPMDLGKQALDIFDGQGLLSDTPESKVEQSGPDGGVGNTADVNQEGAAFSSVISVGEENTAIVNQVGGVDAGNSNASAIDQDGDNNYANVNQEWEDIGSGGPNAASIVQGGTTDGLQGDNNTAFVDQTGAANDAFIEQRDDFDDSSSDSDDNYGKITQDGFMNVAAIHQDDGNSADIQQIGDMNEALIVQDDDNFSTVQQFGVGNQAANYQGDGNTSGILQEGDDNTALVLQGVDLDFTTGQLGPTALGPSNNFSYVTQQGNGNMAEVAQNFDSTSFVNQVGSNHMAVVSQNIGVARP